MTSSRREFLGRDPGRGRNRCSEKAVEAQVKKKLERIDVEKDEEKEDTGEETRQAVVESVAPAEAVVAVPDKREEEKANREGRKSAHGVDEVGVISRHVERDDEKSKREAEDGVAESFKAGDFESALAEAVDIFPIVFSPGSSEHERFICKTAPWDKRFISREPTGAIACVP